MGLTFREQEPLMSMLPDADLKETARTIDNNDAEALVTGAGLALGIVFVITTIALYAYYYTTVYDITAFQNFKQRSGSTARRGKISEASSFVDILIALDKAFAKWGLQSDEACMERIVCESFLPNASKVNQQVSEKMQTIMSETSSEKLDWTGDTTKEIRLRNLMAAAKAGSTSSCLDYAKSCPRITSRDLMK